MSLHPRERFDLVPSEAAEQAFLDAGARGRMHHAWLLCGPEGVGKATFAWRAARHLLGARADTTRGPLGASPSDGVSQLVAAQSHPDLMVLERLSEGGKIKKSISVDQARDLPEFFSKSPSQAAWRVAIVDAADDLNVNAANALLKILEEPPDRGVLLLVAHAPGRLLATLRSRCRRLVFPPLSETAVADLVEESSGLDRSEALRIAGMARGSPGAGLSLASAASLELDGLARQWVDGPAIDPAEQMAVSDAFRGGEGQARFEALMDRLIAAVRSRALTAGQDEAGQGAIWADLWTRMSEVPERTSGVNLDRADVLAGALADLTRVKAAAAR